MFLRNVVLSPALHDVRSSNPTRACLAAFNVFRYVQTEREAVPPSAEVKNCGALPQLPPYVFTALNHRVNFT
jgi:hypothetical protein